MYRPLIFYLALVGALLAIAVMAPAVRGAAIVVPGADAVAVAKKSGGKLDNVKDDDVTRVTRSRRAVSRDEINPKKAFVKNGDVVRKDRIKTDRITGSITADE
ncbi:hypothetical protein GGF31_008113 [Allomyces arbusculus]|nr:hypothetical protein GGF31_008113 [Allomyces arbusculus]